MRNVFATFVLSVALVLGLVLLWYGSHRMRRPAPPLVANPAVEAASAEAAAPAPESAR